MNMVGIYTGAGRTKEYYQRTALSVGVAAPVSSIKTSPAVIIDVRTQDESTDTDKPKKAFKSVKELVAYLTMLMNRWLLEKPLAGEGPVKLEDRANFNKLKAELESIMSDSSIIV